MASLWKHPESKYWVACYTNVHGVQRKQSLKIEATESTRAHAQSIADLLDDMPSVGMSFQTLVKIREKIDNYWKAEELKRNIKQTKKTRPQAHRDRRKYLVEYRRKNKERLRKYLEKRMKKPVVKKQRKLYKEQNREALKAQNREYFEQTKQWREPVKVAGQALKRALRAGKQSWFIELLQLRLDAAKETLALKLATRKYNKRYKRLNAQKLQRKKIEKREATALLQTLAAGNALQN